MKKLIYIILSLIFVCAGCTDYLGMLDNGQEGFVLTIQNSPITKAITNAGTEYERELRTLDCFFYPKGQTDSPCVFYHRAVVNNTSGQVVVPIYVVEDGIRKIFPTDNTCEIFVIANLPDSVLPEGVTFDGNGSNEHTKVENLCNYILQTKDSENPDFTAEYDVQNKPFVMAGMAIGQKDSKKNASATVNLRRAASKITLSVSIPEYLVIKDKQGTQVTMLPQFEQNQDEVALQCAFHNGTYKGYLYNEADEKVDTFLFSSEEKGFTFVKTIEAVKSKLTPELDSIPAKRVFKCEVPFYTYSRAWAKGAADAAYMTFKMPWGYDKGDGKGITYDTYYYQILINGAERSFLPNHWYDMSVNIGVIGSSIENVPIVIDHQLFYVLDWTDEISGYDHPDEDVVLEMYTYFIVNQKLIEIDNENHTDINFHASHTVAWNITSAYYYDNSGVASKQVNITKTDISITDPLKGVLRYEFDIPNNVYSPIYVNLDMWLDFDKDGQIDDNEREYVEAVSIIQYPMMYVVRDESTLRSIYVNGVRNYNSSNLTNVNLGNTNYRLGYADGVRNFEGSNASTNYSMFIINVTSFDEGDTFQAPILNNDGCPTVANGTQGNPSGTPTTQSYKYIIGDPRKRESDINLDGTNVANQWATATAIYPVDGSTNRKLKYYYPTEDFGNSFQIIAPKFRVVSFNNASGKECTAVSAAMRCASLQEDGFPAGRWRLPTIAEVQYIIYLQGQGAIQEIFSSSSSCYATASYGNADKSRRITLSLNETNKSLIWNNVAEKISVRCVYDDWYWGSDRQAVKATGTAANTQGGEYAFTWGDKEITWD